MGVPANGRCVLIMAATIAILSPSSVSNASAVPRAGVSSATAYLRPGVSPGDRITTIFSKTISFTVPGFDAKVSRTSGTDTIVIRAVGADGITADEQYEYDGTPPGHDLVEVRDGGRTNCVDGKCRINDQTSAPLFNPLLWGDIPRRLAPGLRWKTAIGRPWEIGPPGNEIVTVIRLDPTRGLVTLAREGSGDGASTDDARLSTLSITSGGRSMTVKVVPGAARWAGSATIVRGVTLADQIVVERPIDLVTEEGVHIAARQRTYTIFAREEKASL